MRHAAGFTLILLVVLASLNAWLSRLHDSDIERRYAATFDRAQRYATLVWGSSHAAYGVNPRYLTSRDMMAYNFGTGSANATFYVRWYEMYRRYHEAPRRVLLCVDWSMLRETKASHRLEQDSEFFPPDLMWSELTRPGAALVDLLANRFPIIKDRDRYLNNLFRVGVPHDDLTAYEAGFTPLVSPPHNMVAPTSFPPVHPRQVEALGALVSRLGRDGTHVVLVQPPEHRPAADRDGSTVHYDRLAASAGLPFLNYNQGRRSAFNDDSRNFCDWHHLTRRGADAFSRRLAIDLADLPPTAGLPAPRL